MVKRKALLSESEEFQTASTICGHWLRVSIEDMTLRYDHLQDLVMAYYHVVIFEWDPQRTSKHLTLSDDGQSVSKPTCEQIVVEQYRGDSLCSKNILSADKVSVVRWEMTLRRKGSGCYFMM